MIYYDSNLLEIFDQLKSNAAPLLKWLEDAEEESDGHEDDEGDA
jgi:hypothetical protein